MNRDSSNPTASNQPATVVYACSGCLDAGEIADRVARGREAELARTKFQPAAGRNVK